MSDKCACASAPTLIFPCSGGSDVGEITDHVARRMTAEGVGKMHCLAGIGGRLDAIMETTKSAAKILAIDGCKLDCARRTLRQAGFSRFQHIRLNDLGMEKGESPVNDENVEKVALEGASALLK